MSTPPRRADRRRYRKSRDRRAWVFSELNQDLRPEQIAKILVNAGLEQARKEAEARADEQARLALEPADTAEDQDAQESGEAGDA